MARVSRANIYDVVENQERGWTSAFTLGTFIMCCLVMLADGFDNQAINYAAPAIIKEWGINRALMTPVFNISIVGWMTGSIVFAMFADKVGRRPATVLAVLLFGGFTLAIPLATNLYELAALRFCAAFGVGGGMPMAIALISDYAQTKNRGLRITLLYLGYTLGSSGGGFLAAEMIPALGWRSLFYLGGCGAIAVGIALAFGLPESVRFLVLRRPGDPRIAGYARKLQPSASFGNDTSFFIEETVKAGVPVKHLFTEGRSAMTWFLWFALGFSFITHFFLSQWLSTLLDPILHEDAQRVQGLFQLGAAFAFIFGFLVDKKGIRALTLTMILGALPVAAIGLVANLGTGVIMAIALASGILVLGGNIGLNAVSSMIYPTFIRSTATGAAFAVARIGAIIGPAVAGFLIYLDTPLDTIFIIGALPMLAAGAACFMLDKSITPDAAREMASRSALARH